MDRRSILTAAISLISLGGNIPTDLTVRQTVDCVELNHFHDDQAKLIFDQVIWWDWIGWMSDYRVIDWRIDQNAHPNYNHRVKMWVSYWRDTKTNRWREVSSRIYRETWTQHDPEVRDRANLPPEFRTGLLL